ncbi:MAG: glycoside hydrolase family 43 protein [Bacteroidota bacterium]|nr:glycoside hydrolase family 43 protein [Bacteroidota bacterium]
MKNNSIAIKRTIHQLLLMLIILCSISNSSCKKNNASSSGYPPPLITQGDSIFMNPLLSSGPDPWVIQQDTNYYYTNTFGNKIAVNKTSKMSRLKDATLTTIWTPPASGAYSKEIWAPELHFIQNKWYVYFAADDGSNENHRIYAIENPSHDPLSGTWTFDGEVRDITSDRWAIDPSEFEYNGNAYLLWSGWDSTINVKQNIYIAKMKDPLTIGKRVMISSPTYNWEMKGAPPAINEGPEALINPAGKLFLTYSASGCWTDDYALGLLSLKDGGDPLQATDWIKSATPVFTKNTLGGAFGPGHNGFFKSRNGKEDWIIYHANASSGLGCGNSRSPRIQKFTWNNDGSPKFGIPSPINVAIRVPSGE